MIKIQLYNSAAGTLTVTPDAEGTEDLEQTLKRSEQTDGVVFEYSLDLQFIKQARAYLRDVFDLAGGIEAVVVVNVFEYSPNDFKWLQIGTGSIKFTNFGVKSEKVKTSIEQTGFQRKVLNLLETDVDLETEVSQGGVILPATPSVNMTLHSKKIIKETISEPAELIEFQQLDVFGQNDIPGSQTTYRERVTFGNIATDKQTRNELTDSFQLPFGWADTGAGMALVGPASVAQMITYLNATLGHRFPIFVATEAGELTVEAVLKLKHHIIAGDASGDIDVCGDGALGEVEVRTWFEHRDASDNILDLQNIGTFNMPNCGSRSDNNESEGTFETQNFLETGITLNVGDKIYIYETVRVYGDYENTDVGDEDVAHHYRITPQTGHFIRLSASTVTPETTAKGYLIFEALNKMFQFYTDQVDCFRSAHFGRTDSVVTYSADGKGSLRTILSGANIRQLPERTTFVNGQDFYGALNAIDCLGMGFEIRDGRQVVVIEPLSYFYNKDSLILDLGPVSELERVVDSKSYKNQIETAYGKIDIQKTNGIDEFGTLRRWKYPITQVSTKELATTKYKISGYEIEDQRRKILSTEDSKNDENNFFIDVVRDGMTFKPRTTEDFTLIENLFDPDSSYNLNLSPRRNLDNWLQVIAISLNKSPTKKIVFSAGEGNYFMITQKTGEPAPKPEGGPGVEVDLSNVDPLFVPERYKFICPLSSTQMSIIRANPYGYFKFQEVRGGPYLEGYLSKVTRNSKKKLGTFELMKVFRNG